MKLLDPTDIVRLRLMFISTVSFPETPCVRSSVHHMVPGGVEGDLKTRTSSSLRKEKHSRLGVKWKGWLPNDDHYLTAVPQFTAGVPIDLSMTSDNVDDASSSIDDTIDSAQE